MTATGARFLVLGSLLLTPACTMTVLDRYRDGAMAESLYFRVEDYEQPEIAVSWAHRPDGEEHLFQLEDSVEVLTIEPALEGCQFVEVFVNGQTLAADESTGAPSAVLANPFPGGEAIIPDAHYPDCAVVLTFRTVGAPPTFVITAATKQGVVAEFPNGKRRPAWLLLLPLAVAGDAALSLLVVLRAFMLFRSGV